MALTWSVADVQNWDEVCHIIATVDWPADGTKKGDKLMNPVTTALIWHSLNTGIGRIKDESRASFLKRHATRKLDDSAIEFRRHVERSKVEA